jgi:hypothetical protein
MGQMEVKCIFNIGKNISMLAKVTQVSDVAHGPLVFSSFEPIKSIKNLESSFMDLHIFFRYH